MSHGHLYEMKNSTVTDGRYHFCEYDEVIEGFCCCDENSTLEGHKPYIFIYKYIKNEQNTKVKKSN